MAARGGDMNARDCNQIARESGTELSLAGSSERGNGTDAATRLHPGYHSHRFATNKRSTTGRSSGASSSAPLSALRLPRHFRSSLVAQGVCCPTCEYTFVQEDGYFFGGYLINLVVAEVISLGAILVLLLRSDLSVGWQQVIAVSAAILLPVLFYRFSRALWMAFDHITRRDMNEVHIRGGDMH